MSRGRLFVVSGPSGAGKSTVIGIVIPRVGDMEHSVSVTTRDPRAGEIEGREYFFRTKKQFEEMRSRGELLEYAKYVDNYYGTPRSEVEERLKAGIDVILDIDVQGARQVRDKLPEAVLVFLTPPGFEELERRLRARGKDSEEKIRMRLEAARMENTQADYYDYIIINDDIEDASRELEAIIIAEGCRSRDRLEMLRQFE